MMRGALRRFWHWLHPCPPADYHQLQEATRRDILALWSFMGPWNEDIECISFAVVPNNKMHDSGWMAMSIVAVLPDGKLLRIPMAADDLELSRFEGWEFEPGKQPRGTYRFDCLPGSGFVHVWSRGSNIRVGHRISCVTFSLCKPGDASEPADPEGQGRR